MHPCTHACTHTPFRRIRCCGSTREPCRRYCLPLAARCGPRSHPVHACARRCGCRVVYVTVWCYTVHSLPELVVMWDQFLIGMIDHHSMPSDNKLTDMQTYSQFAPRIILTCVYILKVRAGMPCPRRIHTVVPTHTCLAVKTSSRSACVSS